MKTFTFMVTTLLTISTITCSTMGFCCTLPGVGGASDPGSFISDNKGGGWCNKSGQVQMSCGTSGVICPEIANSASTAVPTEPKVVAPSQVKPANTLNPGDQCFTNTPPCQGYDQQGNCRVKNVLSCAWCPKGAQGDSTRGRCN